MQRGALEAGIIKSRYIEKEHVEEIDREKLLETNDAESLLAQYRHQLDIRKADRNLGKGGN